MSLREAILVSFKEARDIWRFTRGADRAGLGGKKGACHGQSPSRSPIVRATRRGQAWSRLRSSRERKADESGAEPRKPTTCPARRHGEFCPRRGSKPRSNSRHPPSETASGFVGREKGGTGRTERSSRGEGSVHLSISRIPGYFFATSERNLSASSRLCIPGKL
jgi:hypothetical protein